MEHDDAGELNRRITFQRFIGEADLVGDYLYLEDFSEEAGKIRLKLKLDDIGDLTGEAYVEHRYLKDSFEGTITLRKDFFYYRDMPQRKPLSDYAE